MTNLFYLDEKNIACFKIEIEKKVFN